MNKLLAALCTFMLLFIAHVSVSADNRVPIIELKGKDIIVPTYNNGCTSFPFVYPKECFYTGKVSKKMLLSEPVINVPIRIEDVTMRNEGKSSQTLCVLISKNQQFYSIVVPLNKEKENKPDEIIMFEHLFCKNRSYRLENIVVSCYDPIAIERIETEYLGKAIKKKEKGIPMNFLFNRFIYMPNGVVISHNTMISSYTGSVPKGEHAWDSLYAEFGDDLKNITFQINTLAVDKSFQAYTLSEIENLFTE